MEDRITLQYYDLGDVMKHIYNYTKVVDVLSMEFVNFPRRDLIKGRYFWIQPNSST